MQATTRTDRAKTVCKECFEPKDRFTMKDGVCPACRKKDPLFEARKDQAKDSARDLERQAANVMNEIRSEFPSYVRDAVDITDSTAYGLTANEWADFEEWRHTPAGREISNLVVRYALQMKRRGWEHFAIEAVVNKIRWEQALKHGPEDGDSFRINNNWKKRLAIWAMTRSDDLKGFFRLRETH